MLAKFILEFSSSAGLGHLSRSSVIAAAFGELGIETKLFACKTDLAITPSIKEKLERFSEVIFFEQSSWVLSSAQSKSEARIRLPESELTILDAYHFSPDWFTEIRNSTRRLLLVSDFPEVLDADFVLDYGFDASEEKHAVAKSLGASLLIGTDFAPVLVEEQTLACARNAEIEVLVSLGGGNRDSELMRVIQKVRSCLPSAQINVLTTSKSLELAHFISAQQNVRTASNLETFALLAQRATFVVVAAGVTMYEALALGKPGFGLTLESNQSLAADQINFKPHFSSMSMRQFLSSTDLTSWAMRVSNDSEDSVANLVLTSAVDSFGALRIALLVRGFDAVEVGLRSLREADVSILFRWANETETRNNSAGQQLIEAEDHLIWFKQLMSGPSVLKIAEIENLPVGQIRFDTLSGETWLSYSVDRSFRGKGLGGRILHLGLSEWVGSDSIFAKVRLGNIGSREALLKAGFAPYGETEDGLLILKWMRQSIEE